MSLTYPGGYITKSPPAPTSTSAPGIWTLDQALQYIKAGTWPVPPVGDPYWQYTTLLSGTGSTNGAQNNTFLDSSTNNFTITRNGNTTQGTFTPFSGPDGYWGNYFDGTGDYLTLADSADWAFGSGNFTIECWVYNTGTDGFIVSQTDNSTASGSSFVLYITSGALNALVYYGGSSFISITDSASFPKNQWAHIALVRNSTTATLYVNGLSVGTGSLSTNSVNDVGSSLAIGARTNGNNPLTGYISNLRIVKGTAVYTAAFTPSTTPLTAISNTVLLTCQGNRFYDANTQVAAKTITVNGNPSVVPFAPFGNTTAYSASSVGGSGYFDGTGDYLSVANNANLYFGTSQFCVEAWVYRTAAGAAYDTIASMYSGGNNGWLFSLNSTGTYLEIWINPGVGPAATGNLTPITAGSWFHCVATRDSSNRVRLFVNGKLEANAVDSANCTDTAAMLIGNHEGFARNWDGYISNFRLIKGSIPTDYQTSSTTNGTQIFTPPTAPATTTSQGATSGDVKFLANFTNAGIYDQAAKNDMETVGNAQVSTSVTKFGNSMYFDGTGDYLPIPVGQTFNFGTGQFTIECWAYFNSVATGVTVVGAADTGGNIADGVSIYCSASGTLRVYGPSVSNSATATVATGQWYHIAVTRIGNTFSLFLNGNLQGTFSDTGSIVGTNSSKPFYIGSLGAYTSYVMNGYLSDFRVTRGLARYTYSFTPPTRAFGNFYQAAATPTADPYFDYTTLLLPGSGTNGAQNNTFLDSSTNAFSITRNGNTTQGTFSPFSQTGWSNFFNGSSYLAATSVGTNFTFGTGDFTWECWAWFPDTSTDCALFGNGASGEMGIRRFSTGKIGISRNNVAIDASSAATVTANQWVHLAISRSSGTLRIFINGSQEYSAANSNSYNVTNDAFIGYNNGVYAINNTYISNMRIIKTGGIYTAAFTPSTTPLTTTVSSGTVTLLSCQSNRFSDNSTNAFALSVTGSPSVQAFSPFAPTAAYSAATNGGSGYFDGTGDYLTTPSNTAFALSGEYTVELWYYPTMTFTSSTVSAIVAETTSGGFFLFTDDSNRGICVGSYGVASQINTSTYPVSNSWNHIVAVRNSSNVTSVYLNGTRIGTATLSTSYASSGSVFNIGNFSSVYGQGYFSGVRVIKGTAVYDPSQTTLTVPTAPFTNITNTSLLCNFTNAGITDATAKNDLETVGNAQISNGAAKFGSTSMYFDGTGDLLLAKSNPDFAFGTGDFTIEGWINWSAVPNSGVNYAYFFALGGNNVNGLAFYVQSGALRVWNGSFIVSGGTTLSTGTWYHVAFVRNSGTLKIYLNGTQDASVSFTSDLTGGALNIGQWYNISDPTYFNGYIQDLRITKGIARYTQNFTPPTAAFQLL